MERTEPRALMWETADLWDRAVRMEEFQVDQGIVSREAGGEEVGAQDLA